MCVNFILSLLYSYFNYTHSLFLNICFNFRPVLSPLTASISIFLLLFGKPSPPWFGAACASCSSIMFLISKGECELIILSIGNEVPIFNILYRFSHLLDWQGVFFMSYVTYTLPF